MSDVVTKANRDVKSLQPLAQKAAQLFLDECRKRNIPIFVTEYHRSQARQDYLYEQGRTREGNIVTWTKSSNHTTGYAWDIACNPPNALYDEKIIAKAGVIARELGIEWGGDWGANSKQKDTPHFQISSKWVEPKTSDTIKINLNGVIKDVNVINKDGNNYVKLRDLADGKIHIDYENGMPIVKVK